MSVLDNVSLPLFASSCSVVVVYINFVVVVGEFTNLVIVFKA